MQLLVLLNNLFKKRESQLLTKHSKLFPPWDPFSSLVEVWKKGSQSNDITSASNPFWENILLHLISFTAIPSLATAQKTPAKARALPTAQRLGTAPVRCGSDSPVVFVSLPPAHPSQNASMERCLWPPAPEGKPRASPSIVLCAWSCSCACLLAFSLSWVPFPSTISGQKPDGCHSKVSWWDAEVWLDSSVVQDKGSSWGCFICSLFWSRTGNHQDGSRSCPGGSLLPSPVPFGHYSEIWGQSASYMLIFFLSRLRGMGGNQ